MSSRSKLKSGDRWMVDPNKKWIVHFQYGSLSSLEVSIDMWGVNSDGSPSEFKSRRKVSIKESEKIFIQLQSTKWQPLEKKFIKAA